MESCIEIQKGTLSMKVRGILSRSWSSKWCMLYCFHNNEPPKLDVYESKEQFMKNPHSCKTIILDGVEHINESIRTTSKGTECIFELVSRKDKHCFSAVSADELKDWTSAFKSVIRTRPGNREEDEDSCENVLYQSHEKPLTFTVEIQETESSMQYQLSGKYLLMVFRTNIALAEISNQHVILSIQLRHIRRYSHTKTEFHFEAGRSSGCEGMFIVFSEYSLEIYNELNKNTKLNNELRSSGNVSQQKTLHDERLYSNSTSLSQKVKPEVTNRHIHHSVVGSENVAKSTHTAKDPRNEVQNELKKKYLEKTLSVDIRKEDGRLDTKTKKETTKEEKPLKKKKKVTGKQKMQDNAINGSQELVDKLNLYDDVRDPAHVQTTDNMSSSQRKANHIYSEPNHGCQSSYRKAPIYSEPDNFAQTEMPINVYSEMKIQSEAWKKYGKEDDAILHKENFENLKVASAEKAASAQHGDNITSTDFENMPDDENPYDHLQRGNVKRRIQQRDDVSRLTYGIMDSASSVKSENVQVSSHIYGFASANPVALYDNSKESENFRDDGRDYSQYEDVPTQRTGAKPNTNKGSDFLSSSKSTLGTSAEESYEECIQQTTASSLATNSEKDYDNENRLYDEIQLK